MNDYIALFVFIPLILIMAPLLIGVFVYKDAANRNMNALMWALISVLVPAFVGLLAYLIVRNDYPDLQCPKCFHRVGKDYVSCPNCGVKLKSTCQNCGQPIQSTWKTCPYCSTSVAYDQYAAVPIENKDTSIVKVLLVLILLPIILVVMALLYYMFRFSVSW